MRLVLLSFFLSVYACSSKPKSDTQEAKLQKLVDKVCACTNLECANAAAEELSKAVPAQAEPSGDDMQPLKYLSASNRCLAKIKAQPQ